jgi:hypothetical protein
MPFMRRRRGGLLGMAARTAVVAGTATAVNHKMQGRYASKEEEQQAQQQEAYEQGQQAAVPPPVAAAPAPAAGEQSVIDQLKQLGELKQQGILTDEEFAQQKAKLLA